MAMLSSSATAEAAEYLDQLLGNEDVPIIVDANGQLMGFLTDDGVQLISASNESEDIEYVPNDAHAEVQTESTADQRNENGTEVQAEEYFLMEDGTLLYDQDASLILIADEEEVEQENSDLAFQSDRIEAEAKNEPFLVDVDKFQKASCDNTPMTIQTSDMSATSKRHCCFFCKQTFIKLARHLEAVHKDEPEVTKFIALPKGSKERREIQDIIRKKGQVDFNTNKKINPLGILSTCRRPNAKFNKSTIDFLTCLNCFGTYAITSIRRHVNKCTNNAFKGRRTVMVLGRAVEGRLHEKASDRLRHTIFPVLKEDEIVRLIRYDWLVITYGNKMCIKYTPHYQHNMIRARLRLCGRLLFALKAICAEVTDFSSLYQPKYYDSVVEAIRIVGRYDSESDDFRSPATASSAVTQIKQIGLMLIAEYIKKDDPESQRRTENFLTLMRSDIGTTILKLVADAQAKMRREKKEKIPSTADIKRLATYLDSERVKSFNQLTEEFDENVWFNLAETTIASLVVFNRRRIGETQNILTTEFENRESINEKSKIPEFQSLSDEAKKVAVMYSRMIIRGKKGRPVPVLMKPGIDKCLELLLKYRNEGHVPPNNKFLFGLSSDPGMQIRCVDAGSALRKFAIACGAKDPETLTGTNMRKHIASICIGMNLDDSFVSELAKFMGHHEKIHRETYRHNTIDNEIVKMSALLEAAQGDDDDDDDDGPNELDVENGFSDDLNVNSEILHEVAVSTVEVPKTTEFSGSLAVNNVVNISKRNHCVESTEEDELVPKKFSKKRWTPDELKAVHEAFHSFFRSKSLPSTKEILAQQEKHPALRSRTHLQIKTWISNQFKKPR